MTAVVTERSPAGMTLAARLDQWGLSGFTDKRGSRAAEYRLKSWTAENSAVDLHRIAGQRRAPLVAGRMAASRGQTSGR